MSSQVSVIHLETGKHLYGGALQVAYLIKGLREIAPSIKNLLVIPNDSHLKTVVKGVETIELSLSGELDPRPLFTLLRILKGYRERGQKTILHIHSRRGADLWGPLAAIFSKTPYVITRRVDNPEPHSIQRLKYKRASKVVAISSAIYEMLMSYGVKRHQLALVPSAVDTDTFRPGGDMEWFQREFEIQHDTRPIGIVAQFIPRKGHRYLIEAIPEVLAREPKARFLFFGKGPLRDQVIQELQAMGLGWACRFPGFRLDMPRIMPCLECLVHPALMEGLGVAVLQAMACKVLVVATDRGGLKDLIRHEETALRLPGSDLAQEISSSLHRVLDTTNKGLFEKIKDKAYRMVTTRFSCRGMAMAYKKIYDEVS